MTSEILFNVQALYGVEGLAVDRALAHYSTRPALFTALWELSVLSDRLFSEFSPDSPPEEMKKAKDTLEAIYSRLKSVAAPSLSSRAAKLLTTLIDDDMRAREQAWRNLSVSLESFNDKIAEARCYRVPVPKESFNSFISSLAGSIDQQAALARVRGLMNSFYTKEVDAILARIEELLAAYQYNAAREESGRLREQIQRESRTATSVVNGGGGYTELDFDPSGQKKVMVVDDVAVILLTVKSLLTPRYQVIPVKDYQAAIKVLSSTPVDLILMDINMPGMDGITLVKVIRSMEAYEKIPIVFLTGNSNRESVLAALGAGGNDFILKPINRDILLQKIDKFLGPQRGEKL